MKKFYILILFLLVPLYCFSKTVLTYHAHDNEKDTRKLYEIEVLELALDKTKEEYGDYELKPSHPMTTKRALQTLEENQIENFILKASATKKLTEQFSYTNFPVDRGVLGYRISFISPQMKDKIASINSIEDLKRLKIGQGVGWLDTDILKYNGFNVSEISNYDSFFYMITLNRLDLFSRGINEILGEYESYKHLKNLTHDETFAIYYPLPRFFFMHKSNEKIIKRVEKGLKLAYEDGSLDSLFKKYYQPSIDFVKLDKRKIYKIENPYIEGLDRSFEKYYYDVLKERK